MGQRIYCLGGDDVRRRTPCAVHAVGVGVGVGDGAKT